MIVSERTMSADSRKLIPRAPIERAVLNGRNFLMMAQRFRLMVTGTRLMDLDIAIHRAEHTPRHYPRRSSLELGAELKLEHGRIERLRVAQQLRERGR